MSPNPIFIPRKRMPNPSDEERANALKSVGGVRTLLVFATTSALLIARFDWARRWLTSGAPILTFIVLLGQSKGYRILPCMHLWTLLATLNLAYAVAATSWLLYGLFLSSCYPAIFLTCLFQFSVVSNLARRNLRTLLKELQFVNDKVAFFNIPALEIDTEVAGLMVVRGVTIHLSSLTIVAHGVELGIKLSDDMEIAIQTEQITVALFRGITVGDVYANLKGGEYEMTFHEMEESTRNGDGDSVMSVETPMLKAAARDGDASLGPPRIKMTQEMTRGAKMKDSSAKAGFKSMKRLSPEDAFKQYSETLTWIEETSTIQQCRHYYLKEVVDAKVLDPNEERAAICSHLHQAPSVPHPPQRSVKVTTLRNLTPPYIREFMHRLPALLRLLLNPLSYFHPISITSITTAGSGKWIKQVLVDNIFEGYGEVDAEIRRLEAKISTWLADANFVFEVADVHGLVQVPFLTEFDVNAWLGFGDVMAYRTQIQDATLKEVIRLGGADATFTIPSFLLPHHEHLLPPFPSAKMKEQLAQDIKDADGKPKTIQAERTLEQAEKDQANIRMAVHASLPACLDQELLNFISALVKATKVVELERQDSPMSEEYTGIKDFTRNLHKATKDGMKKAVVGGVVNDRWIAKMVGKVTKRLETAQGDVGYSGIIPVELKNYRPRKGTDFPSKLLA